MKRYEVVISIDSTEDDDKVRLFIMKSLSQVISVGNYKRYNEDTLKLKIKEGVDVPKDKSKVYCLTAFIIGLVLMYGYQKIQGLL
jgi:hypothetical protein